MIELVKSILRYSALRDLHHSIKFRKFKKRWRKINSNNKTVANFIFNVDLVSVGKCSYGELNITTFNNNSKLIIGNYCSIAQNVRFLLDVEHNLDTILSYPFKVQLLKSENVKHSLKAIFALMMMFGLDMVRQLCRVCIFPSGRL